MEGARTIGIHKGTASRLMAALKREGILERYPHPSKYRPGDAATV